MCLAILQESSPSMESSSPYGAIWASGHLDFSDAFDELPQMDLVDRPLGTRKKATSDQVLTKK